MKSCFVCGTENDDGARFCKNCGAELTTNCPSCGSPIKAGAKFCSNCGCDLHEALGTRTSSVNTVAVRSASPANVSGLGESVGTLGGQAQSGNSRRAILLAADAILIVLLVFAPWLKLDLYYYYEDFTLPSFVKSAGQLGDMLGGSSSASTLSAIAVITGALCAVSVITLAADIYYRFTNLGDSNTVHIYTCVVAALFIIVVMLVNNSISSSVSNSDYSFAAPALSSIIKLEFGAYATAIISGVAALFRKRAA